MTTNRPVHHHQGKRNSCLRDSSLPDRKLVHCRLSIGAIGGIAACALISILLLTLGVFIWHRRERRQEKPLPFGEDIDVETPKCNHTLTGPVMHHTPSLPALPPLRIPSPSDSIMISVSPIESDSDGHPDGTYATSSTESRTRLVSHSNHSDGRFGSIELGSLGGDSESVGLSRGDPKRMPLSLLCPPVMPFDGDPNVRHVSGSFLFHASEPFSH